MKEVRLAGISRKMKNKIKEHGEWWDVVKNVCASLLIASKNGVHDSGKEPYMVWVYPWVTDPDVKILEEK